MEILKFFLLLGGLVVFFYVFWWINAYWGIHLVSPHPKEDGEIVQETIHNEKQ